MRIASRQYSDEGQLAQIERELAVMPDAVDLRFERACCVEDLGWADASKAYVAVLERDPHHLGALTNLGLMARESGELATARALFAQALTHHPLSAIAHVNLGQTLLEQGEVQSAVAQFTAALQCEPDFFAAHHGLGLLYERIGDAERAAHHLERAFARRAAWTQAYRGSGTPLRVLLLVSARGGDIVMHPFLDDRIMETTMIVPEGYKPGSALPPHDVVFNGIGDADRCGKALVRIRALLDASPAAVINDPERVLASARGASAARFAAIPGVIVPRIERSPRAAVRPAELAARGWTFPLLVRAPGFQGGRYFEHVDEPDALDAALAQIPGDELYLIAYVDTRGADGRFRKYRVLFVDGRLYPVHLAISERWKVHYFSSDMGASGAHREEERRFLSDMPGVLGAGAMRALERLAAELGLDYAGVDFGIDAAGNVVVFEANATMAVYVPAAEARWAYRQPAYDAVVAAVRGLIAGRAGVRL